MTDISEKDIIQVTFEESPVNAVRVFLVDASGNYVDASGGGGSSGTQYAEDTVHNTGDTGTFALVVRKDVAVSLCGSDGDYSGLIVDVNGRLHVLDEYSSSIDSTLTSIDGKDFALETTLSSLNGKITACNTGAVVVSSLPDVDVNDISKGTQTNDVKVTLDGESVAVTGTVTANAGTI